MLENKHFNNCQEKRCRNSQFFCGMSPDNFPNGGGGVPPSPPAFDAHDATMPSHHKTISTILQKQLPTKTPPGLLSPDDSNPVSALLLTPSPPPASSHTPSVAPAPQEAPPFSVTTSHITRVSARLPAAPETSPPVITRPSAPARGDGETGRGDGDGETMRRRRGDGGGEVGQDRSWRQQNRHPLTQDLTRQEPAHSSSAPASGAPPRPTVRGGVQGPQEPHPVPRSG